jgi:Gpi18-like mannosyltransferase
MVKFHKVSAIILILVLALVMRLGLSLPQYSGDIKNHIVWAQGYLASPTTLYESSFPGFNDVNYPPLSILLFVASYQLYLASVFIVGYLNTSFSLFPSLLVYFFQWENVLFAYMKLPGILADIGITLLIYQYFARESAKKAILWATLFALSPPLLYVSTTWGQTESVTMFFVLLSLKYLDTSPALVLPIFTLATL